MLIRRRRRRRRQWERGSGKENGFLKSYVYAFDIAKNDVLLIPLQDKTDHSTLDEWSRVVLSFCKGVIIPIRAKCTSIRILFSYRHNNTVYTTMLTTTTSTQYPLLPLAQAFKGNNSAAAGIKNKKKVGQINTKRAWGCHLPVQFTFSERNSRSHKNIELFMRLKMARCCFLKGHCWIVWF